MSFAIVIIWGLSTYVIHESILAPLVVSTASVVACLVAIVFAGISLVHRVNKKPELFATITISVLALAVLLSILSTGGLSSAYTPLWVIVALFAAVVGMQSFIPALLILVGYVTYIYTVEPIDIAGWVTIVLVYLLPLVVGYIIWNLRFQAQASSSQAVSRLAKQLSNESSKSEIVINAIADGVIVIDTSNLVQLINPAAVQIIGWGKDDATGLDYRSVLKIIDDKNQEVSAEFDPVQACMATNQNVITDRFGVRTVSGKQIFVSILVSPISETSSGVIVVFRDITASRAEERGQAEFISTASHEMRTPVAAIEGYLGLALNPSTATIDDKARSYLAKAHEAAQHLGSLFQDLLDVSKAEDGRLNNKPTIVNSSEYTRSIIEDFEGQAKEKGLALIYIPDTNQSVAPIYYINVDQTHYKEIITNLITNALKYSKEGTIRVDVTGDDTHVRVSVKDTGMGIPPEDIPHLFQKFYRVDNSDTREIGGTGLGLYLCRRLAESMDGQLTVDSTYGAGSTFTLTLPRISKEAATSPQMTPQPAQTVQAQTAPAPQPESVPPAAPTPEPAPLQPQVAAPQPIAAAPTPPAPQQQSPPTVIAQSPPSIPQAPPVVTTQTAQTVQPQAQQAAPIAPQNQPPTPPQAT